MVHFNRLIFPLTNLSELIKKSYPVNQQIICTCYIYEFNTLRQPSKLTVGAWRCYQLFKIKQEPFVCNYSDFLTEEKHFRLLSIFNWLSDLKKKKNLQKKLITFALDQIFQSRSSFSNNWTSWITAVESVSSTNCPFSFI